MSITFVLKNIRLIRLERGFSQQILAEYLELTQSSYAKIERGETRLNLVDFLSICRFLNVDPASLLQSSLTLVQTDKRTRPAVENAVGASLCDSFLS